MKKLFLRMLFNKKQIAVIWAALTYSCYKYRQHGNVEGAARVQSVIDEVGEIFGVKQTYTKDEVDAIVKGCQDKTVSALKHQFEQALQQRTEEFNEQLNQAYLKGHEDAVKQIQDICDNCEMVTLEHGENIEDLERVDDDIAIDNDKPMKEFKDLGIKPKVTEETQEDNGENNEQ